MTCVYNLFSAQEHATLSTMTRKERSRARPPSHIRLQHNINAERVASITYCIGVPMQSKDIKYIIRQECKKANTTQTISAINLLCDTLFTHKDEIQCAGDIEQLIKSSIVLEMGVRAFTGGSQW